MGWFEALVLGVVQGVTEFLPISSSAHLILVPWVFGWQDPGLAFDVFLHLGTFFALLGYFVSDLWSVFWGGIASILERRIGFEKDRLLFWWIVFGTIPAVVAGLLWGDYIEAHLRTPLLIAVFLASVGFLMYWIDLRFPALKSQEEMTMGSAFLIGLAQACALVPGVSRSGATIAMARRLGFSREASARFSFLLSVPVVLGALVFESKKVVGLLGQGMDWGYLLTGFFASLIAGMISIHFLLMYLRSANLAVFAWYRAFVAGVIVILSLFLGK